MEICSKIRPAPVATGVVLALSVASPAFASADRAVKACKGAIESEQGSDVSTRLKKISPRGGAYEAWFNLSDGDTQLKAYCLSKRGEIEVITSEGSWNSRNPQRPG